MYMLNNYLTGYFPVNVWLFLRHFQKLLTVSFLKIKTYNPIRIPTTADNPIYVIGCLLNFLIRKNNINPITTSIIGKLPIKLFISILSIITIFS